MNKKYIVLFGLIITILLTNFASAPLIDNLVSYYKLDEVSGVVLDAHGTNNGENVGATPNVTGKINTAYSFDGTSDWININDSASLDITSAITVSMWVNISRLTGTGASGWEGFFVKNTFSAAYGLMLNNEANLDPPNKVLRFYHQGLNVGTSDYNWNDVAINTWYHVVVTYNSSHTNFYINGTNVQTLARTGNITVNALNLLIGTGDVNSYWFPGIIDEVGIWNRSLTQAEITSLYNSGNGFAYPFSVDTCTCAGLDTNWEIDMSDYCNITTACDLGTGTLSFTGAGWCNCNASVDTTNLGDPGATGILYIQDSCLITID